MMRLTKKRIRNYGGAVGCRRAPVPCGHHCPLPGQNLERQLCPHPAEQHAEERGHPGSRLRAPWERIWPCIHPAISEEAYFAGNLFNRKDSAQLSRLFAGLVNSDGVTPALLDELEGMIQTRRNELNK